MENLISAIIVLAVSCLLTYGGAFYLKHTASASGGAERDQMMVEVNRANKEIEGLVVAKGSFVGGDQFKFIASKLDQSKVELAKEAQNLKDTEAKLDSAQKLVEEKEVTQQGIKETKEEDHARLQNLLNSVDQYTREAMDLEQQLAQSQKSLESVIGEVQFTKGQLEVFNQMQETLTNASGRLRDLLMEYQTVTERVKMLNQQHLDLEEEYTRLVEQQLGE